MSDPQTSIDIINHLDGTFQSSIAHEIKQGLESQPRKIPSKYFYDERGSKLFDEICTLPEYYLTRTELSILENSGPEILRDFTDGDLVELGSGSSLKIQTLLSSIPSEQRATIRYVPVDVSSSALSSAARDLVSKFPEMEIRGAIADFTRQLDEVSLDRRKKILFLGSTIGNFEEKDCLNFLANIASCLAQGDTFLLGLDMIKKVSVLEDAYNDSRGITALFNKNILAVVNRELQADFDLDLFRHEAFYNSHLGQIEMHLVAAENMTVSVKKLNLVFKIPKGEAIHTETCRKFNRPQIESLFRTSGLAITRWFTDKQNLFSLVEAERSGQ